MSFGLDGKSCNMKNKKTIFETQTIVTENIEKTIWEYLERFTYTDLVKNYAFQLRKKEIEDKVINNISIGGKVSKGSPIDVTGRTVAEIVSLAKASTSLAVKLAI